MAPNQTNQQWTPQQLERRLTQVFMQDEALGPDRRDRVVLSSYEDLSPYVEFATLKLREMEGLKKEGSLTLEQVKGIEEWRFAAALTGGPIATTKTPAEQAKQHTLAAIQMMDLTPKRKDVFSTTDYRDRSQYIPGATLRLRNLDEVERDRSLTSKKVEGVKGWRSIADAAGDLER